MISTTITFTHGKYIMHSKAWTMDLHKFRKISSTHMLTDLLYAFAWEMGMAENQGSENVIIQFVISRIIKTSKQAQYFTVGCLDMADKCLSNKSLFHLWCGGLRWNRCSKMSWRIQLTQFIFLIKNISL